MPRIARGLVDGFIYHILNRGNGRQEVFHRIQDYEGFIDLMKKVKSKHSIKIFAYCLMPNHFHMVVLPTQAKELGKLMQWLMTSYVRRYHRNYGTSGHIWQGRYKSFIIQESAYLLTVLRYVEGNPVRAGLVNSAKEWLWSSHREIIGEEPRSLIDKLPIELPQEWSKYVDEPLTDKELEKLHQSVNRQSPYGTPMWQMQVAKEVGLESTLRPWGRPRKNG
ncbi:transposase [Candidatus Aerophobetes bacterium]|nr:transposase [Candidatus Aerophobetes bacterium]